MRTSSVRRGLPSSPPALLSAAHFSLREAKEREKQNDADWYRESLRLQRAMAQAELDEQNLREQLRQDQLATLREQTQQANDRKSTSRSDQFGTISGDFYAKFGTSCR
jgi:hypothetical protein